MTPDESAIIRRALAHLTPGVVKAQENLAPPAAGRIYLPPAHRKAFDWDSSIVIGMRGVGKSLWTATLNSPKLRTMIQREWQMEGYQSMRVRVAFGLDESDKLFPAPETLENLATQVEPRHIWRAVWVDELRHILAEPWPNCTSWAERTAWVKDNPELTSQLIQQADTRLSSQSEQLLLVFDSLERLSPSADWGQNRRLLQGALQLALSLRSTRAMRAKLFLRPDMYDDPEPWQFPESSKLKQSRSELGWSPMDLYKLLLQLLVNDEQHGKEISQILHLEKQLMHRPEGGVAITGLADDALRGRMEEIMGKHMGSDARRGMTYTWVPNHLADAKGRVSPRSFLIAFNKAAEETHQQHSTHEHAVHYRAIHAGVTEASRIRVEEIQEDYPWVTPLLEAIQQITVPCSPEDLTNRWKQATLTQMKKEKKLPPRRFTTDLVRRGNLEALLDDLEDLAVISRAEGGRINMPDIFRVAAGIKRKGGVPVAR